VSLVEKLLALLSVLPFGLGLSSGPSAPPEEGVVFSFADPQIIESSGLAVEDGLFATVNDSGDTGRVFTIDPADGRTVAVTTWDGQPADVEAMALTPDGDVLVGDIGDNSGTRDSVELVRVPFGHDGAVDPTTYDLAYPDGSHDAETLLVHPQTGQVLVVAKEFIGRLYAAPESLDEDGTNRLTDLGEVMPIATDGAFFPDGEHFVLRGYGSATFYAWPSLEPLGEIRLPHQQQGEGIAVDADERVYLSSEGAHTDVLEVAVPQRIRAALEGDATDSPTDGGTATATPDPAAQPADEDGADDGGDDRPIWPWAVGGGLGVVILLVLLRSLRPH
jgi:hypothetical protein